MHRARAARRAFGVVVIFGVTLGALGCELLLDFDRSLIDGGAIPPADATFSDAPPPDTFVPPSDAPLDAPDDTNVPSDAPAEASRDSGTDAAVDSTADAADSADALDALDVGIDVDSGDG